MQRFGVGRGKILIYIYMHVCAKLIQSCLTLGDLMDHSLPGSVHGILHQDYWSELFALFQGIFLTQGLNPHLPRGQVGSFPLSPLFAICLSPKQSWVTLLVPVLTGGILWKGGWRLEKMALSVFYHVDPSHGVTCPSLCSLPRSSVACLGCLRMFISAPRNSDITCLLWSSPWSFPSQTTNKSTVGTMVLYLRLLLKIDSIHHLFNRYYWWLTRCQPGCCY